jgi:hypothetical protein
LLATWRHCEHLADKLPPADSAMRVLYRIGAMRVVVGVFGLVGSTALLSSLLTMSGGAVAVATMKNLTLATEVTQGRQKACSKPVYGANLAIASIVFGLIDAAISLLLLKFIPDLPGFDGFCEKHAICADALSERFAVPM